jgi:hypothetical protein
MMKPLKNAPKIEGDEIFIHHFEQGDCFASYKKGGWRCQNLDGNVFKILQESEIEKCFFYSGGYQKHENGFSVENFEGKRIRIFYDEEADNFLNSDKTDYEKKSLSLLSEIKKHLNHLKILRIFENGLIAFFVFFIFAIAFLN